MFAVLLLQKRVGKREFVNSAECLLQFERLRRADHLRDIHSIWLFLVLLDLQLVEFEVLLCHLIILQTFPAVDEAHVLTFRGANWGD